MRNKGFAYAGNFLYRGKSNHLMAIEEDDHEEALSSVRYLAEEIRAIHVAEHSPFVNQVIPINEVIKQVREKKKAERRPKL